MKRLIVATALLAVSCGTTAPDDAELATVASPAAAANQPDPRVSELQVVVSELLDRIEVLNARINQLESGAPRPERAEATRAAEPTDRPAEPATRPAQSQPSPRQVRRTTSTAERPLRGQALSDAYRSALMLYGKGRLDDAYRAFEHIYNSDRSGELADNALFWMAETQFVRGRYADALVTYGKVASEHASENKAPDALLKSGLVHEKLGDLALARSTFEQLIATYPYSTAAAAAREEIKRIRY